MLLLLTGDAAGYVILILESWKFTSAVERVRTPFGAQASNKLGRIGISEGTTGRA